MMQDKFIYGQDIAAYEAAIIRLYGDIYLQVEAGDKHARQTHSLRRLLRTESISGEVICAEDGLAGFIIWSQIQDACADIIELCIAPSYRRQGLAASLLDNMKQQAISRNITQITLEVRQTNLAACALYEKAGFQVMHRRTGYYQTRDGAVDALLMACRLGC